VVSSKRPATPQRRKDCHDGQGEEHRAGRLIAGGRAYEAHMTNADGDRVTVYVNAQFEVVSVESGR
jgi:hypothetical protein